MSIGVVLEIDEGRTLGMRAKSIEYVVTERGCWNCISHAPDRNGGYPRVRRSGPQVGAHRYVYELLVKKMEVGLHLCHHCDNPLCVNPAHMFEGTHKENMEDMVAKGRQGGGAPAGEKNGRAKLTKEQVLRIRELHSTGEYSQAELARMFGVDYRTMHKVVHRHNWRHINNGKND